MKALIVDDTSVNLRIMVRILSDYAECQTANSGQEAIDLVTVSLENSKPFDLICMDIMMPGIDGIQSVKKIRELEANYTALKQPKILMVTTIKDDAYVKKSIQAGCDGYVLKPVDKYNLLKHLEQLGILNAKKRDIQ